jgi:hypothetical protein
MNMRDGSEVVKGLRTADGAHWKNPLEVATQAISRAAVDALTAAWPGGDFQPSLVQLHLTEVVPGIERFDHLVAVNALGIWFCDADGDVDDTPWRPKLIPWHVVRGVHLVKAS